MLSARPNELKNSAKGTMKKALIISIILMPAHAFAGDWGSEGMLPAGLKLVGAMIIILGLVLLLYYISRKGFSFLPAAKTGAIKLIEMRYLMPKKALCLVEVRGKELLLGIGNDRIELISRLERHDTPPFEETLQSSIEEGQ